ncbi:MAG TPA: transglycosylase SLT domain-containing protein [Acidimicrobiales bacterium]|nr:transglycosylase SLT domain-containing protein [Acidimicrobiales bacterium]
MKKALMAVGAVVAMVPFLVAIAAMGMFVLGGDEWPPVSGTPAEDPEQIPVEMSGLYYEAATRFGISRGLLAAVGKVECDHGRNPACQAPNSAGAIGPMQFLPATFAAWSWASTSPEPSALDPRDAVFAAAAKLAGDGAAADPSGALFAYNPSRSYVATVEAWALAYGWTPPDPGVLVAAVLDHPRIRLRPAAKRDVHAGVVDERVLAVLLVIATRHDLSGVGPFASGHSYFVAGTERASNHAFGRAVDLALLDGVAVSESNDVALAVVRRVARLPLWMRPDEIGCPWRLELGRLRTITKAHGDHLHFGWST